MRQKAQLFSIPGTFCNSSVNDCVKFVKMETVVKRFGMKQIDLKHTKKGEGLNKILGNGHHENNC